MDHTQVYVDIRQSDSEDGVPVGTGDSGPYSTPLGGEGVSPHFPYQPCRACRTQQQNYLM